MTTPRFELTSQSQRFFGNLPNTESLGLQLFIVEKVQQQRKAPPPPPLGAGSLIGEPISLEAELIHVPICQKVTRLLLSYRGGRFTNVTVHIIQK